MIFRETSIQGVFIIVLRKFSDARGHFAETFHQELFRRNVGDFTFVQDNQSLSVAAGTIRGLHFQTAPKAQGKLVRCIAGAAIDVAVDIRRGSPTFGQHVAVELSAENAEQIWIPPGFAHGFCTLQPNTEISYKVTDYYSAEHEHGLQWNDPTLGITWPVGPDTAVLSDKDRIQPALADVGDRFTY